ncbi:MAG: hypothetical protein KAS93_02750 [Gammaproteobacteria bacterium]|nr:hypothetical protein [Gammaproteobacteria bacterium]
MAIGVFERLQRFFSGREEYSHSYSSLRDQDVEEAGNNVETSERAPVLAANSPRNMTPASDDTFSIFRTDTSFFHAKAALPFAACGALSGAVLGLLIVFVAEGLSAPWWVYCIAISAGASTVGFVAGAAPAGVQCCGNYCGD